jgi:hypothetical protein
MSDKNNDDLELNICKNVDALLKDPSNQKARNALQVESIQLRDELKQADKVNNMNVFERLLSGEFHHRDAAFDITDKFYRLHKDQGFPHVSTSIDGQINSEVVKADGKTLRAVIASADETTRVVEFPATRAIAMTPPKEI